MPATLIGPLWNERKVSTSVNSDGIEVRNITLPFLVKNKTFRSGVLEALACPDLPGYGDTYAAVVDGVTMESDDGLPFKGKQASQHDGHPQYWRVECEFGSDAYDPNRQDRNPLFLPPDFRWGRERFKEGAEVDLDGEPLLNAAGVPYQAIDLDSTFKVLEITRNLPTWEESFFDDWEDLVNTDEFEADGQVFEPYRCKVHEITTSGRKFLNNTTYWPCKLVVHIKPIRNPDERPRPWHLYLLNAGLEYWDAGAGTLKPFTDAATGRPTSTPQLLAVDGSYLVSQWGGPLGLLEPNYRDFRFTPEDSYADLAALFVT